MTAQVQKEIREISEMYREFSSDARTRIKAELRAAYRLLKLWPKADPAGARAASPPSKMRRAIAAYNLAANAANLAEQEAAVLASLRSLQAYYEGLGIKLPSLDDAIGRRQTKPAPPPPPPPPPKPDAAMERFLAHLRSVCPDVEFAWHPGSDRMSPGPRKLSYGLDYAGRNLPADEATEAEIGAILGALGCPPEAVRLVSAVLKGRATAAKPPQPSPSVSPTKTAHQRLAALRAGRVPYQQKKGALFSILMQHQGETLRISDLMRQVGSPDTGRMCRLFQADGAVNGGWIVEFPKRGYVRLRLI